MLTQPSIAQLSGVGWIPIAPHLWHLATQTGPANNLADQLKALGIADAHAIDMAGYIDPAGNFHNDIVGMFQYFDPATRFYGIIGTIKEDGTGKPDIPIYEAAGDLWDRMTKPNPFFDKPAPTFQGGNQEPFPNGAKLRLQAYPAEGYATIYWSWQ